MLFNLITKELIRKMKESTTGVKINEGIVHCTRFADDIALRAENGQ